MTPLQHIVSIGILHIRTAPRHLHADMLEQAAEILPPPAADACRASATCIRHAEQNQTVLEHILREGLQ